MKPSILSPVATVMLALAGLLAPVPLYAAPKLDAINVAVYGFEYPQNAGAAINLLEANGYNTDRVMLSDIATGLPGYDILYVTHPFDAGGWSPLACNGLKSFLSRGKGVVLEWDASLLAFNALGPSIYVNATPQCGLFVGVADNGRSVGFNTPITIVDSKSPVVTGLVSPIAMGAASDYMYQITGFDPKIWIVDATYPGWNLPANMALMHGRYNNAGCVAIGTMAFADNGYSILLDLSSRFLLLNMISTVTPGSNKCVPKDPDPVPDPDPPPPVIEDGGPASPVPTTSLYTLLGILATIGASALLMRERLS